MKQLRPKRFKHNNRLFQRMLLDGHALRIIDTVKRQLEEIFLLRNPSYKYDRPDDRVFQKFLTKMLGNNDIEEFGEWFLFPWNKLLIHFLPDKMHQELRTARNKNLITNIEQETYYKMGVGIAGLSVGSHAAFVLTMMGGGQELRLADPDDISGSNLNRIRYGFSTIGNNKAVQAASELLEINPYSKILIYPEGITEKNIESFFLKPKRIDVLIEEVDNLSLKFKLRFVAKRLQIPVIMATDNDDGIIVDIERYDQNPGLPIFNGLLGDLKYEDFIKIPKEILPSLVGNIVGLDYISTKILPSLIEVGKSLYSWPQLGDAASLSGSVIAYLIKQISLGKELQSGKYEVNLNNIFQNK